MAFTAQKGAKVALGSLFLHRKGKISNIWFWAIDAATAGVLEGRASER